MARSRTAGRREQAPLWRSLLLDTFTILKLSPTGPPEELKLAIWIREGLPADTVQALLDAGVDERDVFDSVIARRTWQRRREAQEPLSSDESDRAARVAQLLAMATAVFDDHDRALLWLNTPKRRFEGQRPLDLVGSSVGARLVEETLLQAYYGNVA